MRCPDLENDTICKACVYHGKDALIVVLATGAFDASLSASDNICAACECYGRRAGGEAK